LYLAGYNQDFWGKVDYEVYLMVLILPVSGTALRVIQIPVLPGFECIKYQAISKDFRGD
jgi:hypothetical protein